MKRTTLLIYSTAVMMLLLCALTAFADSDIDQFRDCKQCGMDRKAYGYSRMLVEYKNGTKTGACSLHCVATELANGKSGEISSFKVADRDTTKLIDAEKAVWVIGGSKRGVMTMQAKWAFSTKEAARKFIAAYGGKLATWNEALTAAKAENMPKIH